MNSQINAFQWSCLIHGLFIGAVIGLGLFFKSPPKMQVINFDLEPASARLTESQPAQQPAHSKKQQNLRKEASVKAPPIQKERPMPKPLDARIKEPLPEPQPQVTAFLSEQAVPISPTAKTQTEAEKPSGPSGASVTGTGGGATLSSGNSDGFTGNPKGRGQGSGSIEDKTQTRYLRTHFAYIRDKILRNIRYPAVARRLGWQGRVLLSFVITVDGSIKEAKIMQGSGFEVLDKNAVETVKDTAPFPKPPAEARLIIPITYRLD